MPEIGCEEITNAVVRLCVEANYYLSDDVVKALCRARDAEQSPLGREVLGGLLENADVAREEGTPLCQDTALTVFLLEIGRDVHIVGGDLTILFMRA